MKTNKVPIILAATCSLLSGSLSAQTVVDAFEYENTDALLAVWTPSGNTVLDLTNAVASTSTGLKAMSMTFNFPSGAWATETVKAADLSAPIAIGESQYVTFRIKGDPAFAPSDFKYTYLYAYDSSGNFGRWGVKTPTTTEWQAVNFAPAAIAAPWDSPGLPDFNDIVRFSIYQYGSETAIPAYTATVLIDDIVVRDTPLTDPAPIGESVVETFEYATDTDLKAAWVPSAEAAVSLATDVSAASTGLKCMKVNFNFPSVTWTTEFVKGPVLSNAVAMATNQYVVVRMKGDPAFAAADYRTFFVYAYDDSGNFGRWGANIPTNSNWEIFNFSVAAIAKPWDSPALPNLTRIVQFAIFQYGSETALPAYSASIEVDDILIRNAAVTESPTDLEQMIDAFEYESDEALLAAYTTSANALPTMSDSVDPKSKGKRSLSIAFNFPSIEWATESVRGVTLPAPISIGPKQYLSFRIKGDPAFASSDFQSLFLYAYDSNGNFGRWGAPAPTNAEWQVFNFLASSVAKPWDSESLPDLSKIVKIAFFQYGSGAAIPEYTATIGIDDLMVRNTPEFPDPAPFRAALEDFESYAATDALTAFYGYEVSPASTVATAQLETPAPQGSKALKLTVDFAGGQSPWGSVKSGAVTPFSFPSNGVVSLRLKGDSALAAKADGGTSFWLTFYDQKAQAINFITTGGPVIASEWTTLQARLADFGNTAGVDVGNLVQWRLRIQAYEGQAAYEPMSATIYVDDLRLSLASSDPVKLAATRDGSSLRIQGTGTVAGKTYVVYSSTDLKQWTAGSESVAGASGATWTLPISKGQEFFKVAEKTQ